MSHAGRIVVLTTRPTTGHVNPAHRLLFFDPARDSLEASDPWTGGTLRAVHHDGARIVVGPDDRIRMIALRGVAELEGVAPTGRQRVSVHLVDWNLEGEVVSDIPLISFPDEPTEMCPGGCEAAITVRGDRAVVSYAPRGRLYTVEIELGEEPVVRDWVEGPIAEPSDPLPWPHRAVIVGDERWVAGGGTLDLEPPRESWLISPGARRAIEGSMHDPPPMLLGGADAVLARYVSSRSGFVVQNLTTGEARTVVPVAGHTPPLANQLVRFPSTGRLGLVWASYAPDALRDTLVSMTPDVPSSCDAVEPTTLIRVPEGVARPSLYLHPMGTDAESFLFVMPAGPGGSDPEVAVFEVPECALVNG